MMNTGRGTSLRTPLQPPKFSPLALRSASSSCTSSFHSRIASMTDASRSSFSRFTPLFSTGFPPRQLASWQNFHNIRYHGTEIKCPILTPIVRPRPSTCVHVRIRTGGSAMAGGLCTCTKTDDVRDTCVKR